MGRQYGALMKTQMSDFYDLAAAGEVVAPRLDAGQLELPQEMGEEILSIDGRRGEGLRLADGGVDALFQIGIFPPGDEDGSYRSESDRIQRPNSNFKLFRSSSN